MVNTTCMMKLKEILHGVWDVGELYITYQICLHVLGTQHVMNTADCDISMTYVYVGHVIV